MAKHSILWVQHGKRLDPAPKVFRVTLGITSNVSQSDHRLYVVLGFTTSRSDKYCGARPFSVLKT